MRKIRESTQCGKAERVFPSLLSLLPFLVGGESMFWGTILSVLLTAIEHTFSPPAYHLG